MDGWVAVDLETTGRSPTRNRIRELAAVPLSKDDSRQSIVLTFSAADWLPAARAAMRRSLATVIDFIGKGGVMVAHNAAFDLAFLAETLRKAQAGSFALRAYCTMRLARALLPQLARYDLVSLREALGVGEGPAHVALADARTVAALFRVLAQRSGVQDESGLRALHGPPFHDRYRTGGADLYP